MAEKEVEGGMCLYGGMIVMSISVDLCGSEWELIGCVRTTSPGRICGALSNM